MSRWILFGFIAYVLRTGYRHRVNIQAWLENNKPTFG